MITDLENIFSNTANNMKRSAIREILKLTQNPDVISFAGGLPAPDSFPVDDLKSIVVKVLEEDVICCNFHYRIIRYIITHIKNVFTVYIVF